MPSPPTTDDQLLAEVRAGRIDTYGQLYRRHVDAAYNLARRLGRCPADADDLVSDAFTRVLDAVRAGGGPESAFRAYLLTVLRHTAYEHTRVQRRRRMELTDDVSGIAPQAVSVPFKDSAVVGLERSLAVTAFTALPERWRTVLLTRRLF